MSLNLGISLAKTNIDTEKYNSCPRHTQDECRNRTSNIHCSHYGQLEKQQNNQK